VTNANGQYQVQIQEARLLREQYRQAAVDTRRRVAEEARYERDLIPAEQGRGQREQTQPLGGVRNHPPLSEILSARALNDLYRRLASEQGQGRASPEVRLGEDVLKKINLAPPGSRANAGLLKDGGKLRWPVPLQGKEFADGRASLQRALEGAVRQVQFNHPVAPRTLTDLTASLRRLRHTLHGQVAELSPSEYVAGLRYLRQLGNAVTALSDPEVATWFNPNRAPEAKTVGGLVRYMAGAGLEFAAAVPGDEAAYAALYNALAALDAQMQPDQE
jgi:hypothetical protein